MSCHEGASDKSFELPDDSIISVDVSRQALQDSVHAKEVGCTDCHTGISEYPHPELTARTKREYELQQADTCKRCHYAHYTRVIDGIHFELMKEGDLDAPTCVDCHGAHDIANPSQPRTSVDQKCAKCHEEISEAYRGSVHGKALINEGNADVPVCTDCHGSHAIDDPRKADFHARSHEICARCHSDSERMDKYGLSTAVVDTYLDDFHGRSNALYAAGAGEPNQPLATCTDCHGIHDIPSFKEVDTSVVRARVLEVCRRCHEEVPDGFQDAWMSHWAPTLSSAPMLWAITWFYRIAIPLILLGLVLHILLHLWRYHQGR